MTFNRFTLIQKNYDEKEANQIISIISKHTPCESKTYPQKVIRGGVEQTQLCFAIEVDVDRAISICDMKLTKSHVGTNTKRWTKLKKILNNMKEI